jgi:hypothetical protein
MQPSTIGKRFVVNGRRKAFRGVTGRVVAEYVDCGAGNRSLDRWVVRVDLLVDDGGPFNGLTIRGLALSQIAEVPS